MLTFILGLDLEIDMVICLVLDFGSDMVMLGIRFRLRGSLHESGLSFNPERHFEFNLCLHEGLD